MLAEGARMYILTQFITVLQLSKVAYPFGPKMCIKDGRKRVVTDIAML